MSWPGADEAARSFVAVELTENVVAFLRRLVTDLGREGLPSLRLVDPVSVHVTLKFLGQVPGSHLRRVAESLDAALGREAPFLAELRGLGAFPNLRAPRVLWAGLEAQGDRLRRLARVVEVTLSHLGFDPEARPFTPHITLGRLRDGASPEERRRAGKALERLAEPEGTLLPVEGVSLMRSFLLPSGVQYAQLHRTPLSGPGMAAGPTRSESR